MFRGRPGLYRAKNTTKRVMSPGFQVSGSFTISPSTFDPRNGRTPDIIMQTPAGTIYSGSGARIAEHGGFSADNTHVLLIVSNPKLEPHTVAVPVTNMQVAPTILKALGLKPRDLQTVRQEGTCVLPGLGLDLED